MSHKKTLGLYGLMKSRLIWVNEVCADAQGHLRLRCSHMRYIHVPKSYEKVSTKMVGITMESSCGELPKNMVPLINKCMAFLA